MPDILLWPSLLPWSVVLPLLWAVLSLAIGRRGAPALAAVMLLLVGLSQVGLTWQWWQGGDQILALGHWAAPLGIHWRLDGLALTLLLLSTLVVAACALHASIYLLHYPRASVYFWPLMAFAWAGLNAIWLSADLFNLYVGLELLGMSAVGLVALTGEKTALGASLRYLYAALLGSMAYLLGVALIYGRYGVLDFALLAGLFEVDAISQAALLLMTLGLLFKTAIFPLHGWLPPAHANALPPVSGLLSALVVKASFYILLRLWAEVGLEALLPSIAQLLGWMGAGAVLWGGWMAWKQTQLKLLVAYSTVAQLGYLMLVFPLIIQPSALGAQLAWEGGWIHLISHALAKTAMFLAAGNLVLAMRRPDLIGLHGAGRYLPFSLLGFGLAGVSIMGLPPSGGFIGKWLLLHSAFLAGQWWWIGVILIGSALSAMYIFKVYQQSYIEVGENNPFDNPPMLQDISSLGLSLLALALGIFSAWPQWLVALSWPGGAL